MALKKRSHSTSTRKKISQSLKAYHAQKKKGKFKNKPQTENPGYGRYMPATVKKKVKGVWAAQKEHDRRGNKNKAATARKVQNARKAFSIALKATKKPKKKR